MERAVGRHQLGDLLEEILLFLGQRDVFEPMLVPIIDCEPLDRAVALQVGSNVSRQSSRMTTESVRNVVRAAAEHAGVRLFSLHGRSEASAVTPHTLRHSVTYRMLNCGEGNTLYDVTNQLRHATIQTTERVYAHMDRV